MLRVTNLSGFGAGGVGVPLADALLLESGDFLLKEDGGKLLLDNTGDKFFSSVVLGLSFDEADGATETDDFSNSNHAMTFQSGAEIDSAQSLFGNVLLLDGSSNGQITSPDHVDWSFGSAPFTLEGWVRLTAITSNFGTIISQYNFNGNQRSWTMNIKDSQISFGYSFNGSTALSVTSDPITVNNDVWYHVAATRDSNHDIRLLFEGTLVKTENIGSSSLKASTSTLNVGGRASGGTVFGNGNDGRIEDLRVTKGVARYVTSFTPSGPNRHPNE